MLLASPAAAQEDFLASIFTDEGTELRHDERVFALYAMLNAAGYDAAPTARTEPVARRRFHPIRVKVRDALRGLPAELRARIDAFLDAHVAPANGYLLDVLALSPPPKMKRGTADAPATVEGLEGFLNEFYAKAGLGALSEKLRADHRAELKRLQPHVDAPLLKARAMVKGPSGDEAPRLVVAVNPLDDPANAWARLAGDEILVVAGVGEGAPDLEPLAAAYVRLVAASAIAAAAPGVKNGEEVWGQVRATAAGHDAAGASFPAHVAETFARVAALRAVGKGDAEVDALYRSGYFLAREALRVLSALEKMEGGGLSEVLAAELPKVDARKVAAEFLKSSGCFPATK